MNSLAVGHGRASCENTISAGKGFLQHRVCGRQNQWSLCKAVFTDAIVRINHNTSKSRFGMSGLKKKFVQFARPRITNKTAQNARKPLVSTPESQLIEVAVC